MSFHGIFDLLHGDLTTTIGIDLFEEFPDLFCGLLLMFLWYMFLDAN